MNSNIARTIIKEGYFRNDLPSEFKSEILSEKIDEIDISKQKLSRKGLNRWSKLVDYSVPKKNEFRRILSVPHPLHYLKLSKIIQDNWDELSNHYNKSRVSLSAFKFEDNKLSQKHNMSDIKKIRLKNLAFNRYILCIDINRYYPRIYTHSIPWALHSKKTAKENMRGNNLLGNKIDLVIRNMQDGETMGIPIGPMSSMIVQEIISCSIDEQFQIQFGKEVKGSRYTDDMEYYFNDIDEAKRALSIMRMVLEDYSLDLNDKKTEIKELPLEIEPEWIYYLKSFRFRNSKNDEIQAKFQKLDLMEFFNKIYIYKIETNDKGIAKYALKVLRNRIILKSNWSLFKSLLFQTSLTDTTIIPIVFEIIESYKYKGYEINNKKLTCFLNSILEEYISLNYDYEIICTLSFANKFNVKINKEITKSLSKYKNALVNIMVMILNDKKLLNEEIDLSHYKSLIEDNNLYDENWIFLYECCRRGKLEKNDSILKDDMFFNQLNQHNVSFVDPEYSSVKEDVKSTISYLCYKEHEDNPNISAEEALENIMKKHELSLKNDLKKDIILSISEKFSSAKEDANLEENKKVELDSWTKLFLASKPTNKQINLFVDWEY